MAEILLVIWALACAGLAYIDTHVDRLWESKRFSELFWHMISR